MYSIAIHLLSVSQIACPCPLPQLHEMAATSDLEAGRTISRDTNIARLIPSRIVDTEAELLARKQGAKRALEQESSRSIAAFEESRRHAEERVGVLLLLRYKYALDELNTVYDGFVHEENYTVPVDLAASSRPEDYGMYGGVA